MRAEAHRLFVAWEPRAEPLEVAARRLVQSLDWLRSLPELEGSWTAVHRRTGAILPCDGVEDALRCLEAGAYPIEPETSPASPPPPELYRQCFYLGPFQKWRAKIVLACGFARPSFGDEAPNGFELWVPPPLPPIALRQALVGLIGVHLPVWGVVGSESFPASRTAHDGAPSAGWLTYLSSWFGPPAPLGAPVLTSNLGHLGALYQAFSGTFDRADAAHVAGVRALERSLRAAGALRPYAPAPG